MKQVINITVVFLISFLLLVIIFPKSSFAVGLVINEFSSASNPEWVEIYNSDEQTYSLQGVVLFFDSTSTTQKVSFCDNDEISAKSFKLITRPVKSYWLFNSGDTLILKKEDDIIDSISYGSGQSLGVPTSAQSISRIPDGDSWVLSNSPSPQGDEASFVCPTPTSIPPTPTPTSVPTSTPVLTNTPTPKPTSAPTLTPTPSPTPTIVLPTEVLGESTKSATLSGFLSTAQKTANETKKKEAKVLGEQTNNTPKILIGIGVIFLIAGGIIVFRTRIQNKLNKKV